MVCMRSLLPLINLAIVCVLLAAPASAADKDSGRNRENTAPPVYKLSYTPIYQFDADLDTGGKFNVQRHFLRFGTTRFINRHWMAGIGLGFDYERWDFTSAPGLAGVDLWDEIFRTSVNIPIFYSPGNQWRFGLIPAVDFAGASGAETSESASYGAVFSAACTLGPDLMLGLGAGVFNRLDQTEGFPYVVVNWKINEQLRLTNPFTAGPVGPAGLELVYKPDDLWEFGAGGAYRSYRFRLDDSSTVADGISQVDFWAPFLKAGRHLGKHWRLDINGGATMNGSITIEDKNANRLGSTDYDTAPFVGLTISGRF